MRGWLLLWALMVNSCAPSIAPAPPACTQSRRVITRPFAMNLMFVIDRSIATPQLNELTHALQVFISRRPTFARYGIAVLPHDDVCGASDQTDVLLHLPDAGSRDEDIDLEAQSDRAVFALNSITQRGQPEMGSSLRLIGSLPELHDGYRSSFLILLTQGIPGCETDGGYGGTLAALSELANDGGILTNVIPFSADLTDAGTVAAFDALVHASGFSRFCFNSDSECALPKSFDGGSDGGPGGICNAAARVCEPAFISATNADELEVAVILPLLPTSFIEHQDPCAYSLDWKVAGPTDLAVYVDGVRLSECDGSSICDAWQYDDSGVWPKVIFEGVTCEKLKDATAFNPVQLAFVTPSCER